MLTEFIRYLSAERRYSPLTVRNYKHDVEQFLAWLDCDESRFDPRSVTTEQIREWIIFRTEEGKLSAGSMNPESRMTTIVSECGPDSEDFLTERNSLIILMFYACGLRLAELVGIDRSDFSADYTSLRVRGKGDKQRMVPILEFLREKILHYLGLIERQNICISSEKALFLTHKGKRISRSVVYRTVQEELTRAGVQGKKSPHVLRHTIATHLLNGGADMREIQELLGHASLQATQVYTHNSIARLREIYAKAHPREKGGK